MIYRLEESVHRRLFVTSVWFRGKREITVLPTNHIHREKSSLAVTVYREATSNLRVKPLKISSTKMANGNLKQISHRLTFYLILPFNSGGSKLATLENSMKTVSLKSLVCIGNAKMRQLTVSELA